MDYSGILALFKVTMKDHRGGILTGRTLVKLFFFSLPGKKGTWSKRSIRSVVRR